VVVARRCRPGRTSGAAGGAVGREHAFLQELHLVLGDRLIAVVSAVERSCRALGARSLTVSVPESLPACSSDAQAVLEHCGFRVAAQTMAKALT
jgi:hypothetical protein